MKIMFIGKFAKMHDEEYIAQGFEKLGHEVIRIPLSMSVTDIKLNLDAKKPDILIYCKWEIPNELIHIVNIHRTRGMKTVCWLFDLYFGYHREYQVKQKRFFQPEYSDYVFTTDGGHDERFRELGINHYCVRQGIREEECYIEKLNKGGAHGVVFVGSENTLNTDRMHTLQFIQKTFKDFRWIGRGDTDEMRGEELNKLYAEAAVVIGDSVYSPYYWSNRVVETLGRGGMLIHHEVEGIKEEYPHLVTYTRGNMEELKNKIMLYLFNPKQRQEKIEMNYEWVKNNYTIEKKCAELLSKII